MISTLAIALVTAAAAFAKDPEPIVLVHDQGQELLVARLRDELYALGWFVVEIAQTDRSQTLGTLAQRVHAFAGIRIARGGELELWVASTTGRAAFQERLRIDATDPEVAALRTVEIVRTRFLELGLAPPSEGKTAVASPGDVTSNEDETRAPGEPAELPRSAQAPPETTGGSPRAGTPRVRGTPRYWLGIAPAIATSPGGLGLSPLGVLGFRVVTASRWSLGGIAALPLLAQTVEASQGSAEIRWGLLLVRAEHPFTSERSAVDVSIMGGAGGVLMLMEGKAERPYGGRSDSVAALALCAGPALTLSLSRVVTARAELWGGIATPRPSVRFASETVATWGQPFGLATVGVEVGLGP